MLGRNLVLALRQLWVTLVPAVIASVPVIFLLVWVSNAFDARLPSAGQKLEVEAYPSAGHELPPLHWRGGDAVATGAGTWSGSGAGEARGMLGRNVVLALRQLWVTLVPAVIASVPVIFLLVWVSTAFDARLPGPGQQLEVAAHASDGHELPPLHWRGGDVAAKDAGTWSLTWPADDGTLELVEADGTVLLTLPTAAPVGVVHQRRWWNTLFGNPAGYLPSPGDVDAVEIDLPKREFVPFGPDWLRGWIAMFFGVVIIISLLLKFLWRLH
jgi:hypothetical protein